jgi:hypothetical protein
MRFRKSLLFAVIISALTITACSQSHYVATDPAIREMLISLDMPRTPQGERSALVATPSSTPILVEPAANLAGRWNLELLDGTGISLDLLQSGNVVFGRGNLRPARGMEDVTASGSLSGSILRLDVVPASGEVLYAISLDIGKLPLEGTYVKFSARNDSDTGMIKASWLAA